MKRVLMLNAGYTEEPVIRALKDMDCYVITTGNRPDFSGHKLADEYIYGDFSDKELMLQIAKEKKVDAICPCCSDFSVKTAAYVSEKLGFKGQDSYNSAVILHDKDRFKEFAKRVGGINTPLAESFDAEDEVHFWAENEDLAFPLIVKPVDLDSGKGIMRVNNRQELFECVHNAFTLSRSKRIVVEPFIEGTQHGMSAFLVNKKVAVISSEDEDSFINPYRVEVGRFPATCHNEVKDDLVQQVERMAELLDLSDGIFHLQYIYCNGKAYILECMRRILGNLAIVCAQLLNGGFDWNYWHTRAVCGFGLEGIPKNVPITGYYSMRSLTSRNNGIFCRVEVPEDIQRKIVVSRMHLEPGDVINNHVYQPAGVFLMKHESEEEMKHTAIDEYDRIRIIVE